MGSGNDTSSTYKMVTGPSCHAKSQDPLSIYSDIPRLRGLVHARAEYTRNNCAWAIRETGKAYFKRHVRRVTFTPS